MDKYSPLWYSMMCMKAFCEGDRKLAGRYYDMGQEILTITDSDNIHKQGRASAEALDKHIMQSASLE